MGSSRETSHEKTRDNHYFISIAGHSLVRPSWRLHGLTGDRAGFYAVTVQANWRLAFRFVGADVELLDYLDSH